MAPLNYHQAPQTVSMFIQTHVKLISNHWDECELFTQHIFQPAGGSAPLNMSFISEHPPRVKYYILLLLSSVPVWVHSATVGTSTHL